MALIKSTRRVPRPLGSFGAFPPMPTFDELENRMRKIFETGFGSALEADLVAQPIGWLPVTDIVEANDELVLTAELPGMQKKDVDIAVEDGVLTVRGEKLEEKKDEEAKYHLFERTYGSFQRSFTLPRFVDAEKISAEFADGVLTVHMPKTPEAKAKGRKVEIAVK